MLSFHFGVLFVEFPTIKELIISACDVKLLAVVLDCIADALLLADSGTAARSKFAR